MASSLANVNLIGVDHRREMLQLLACVLPRADGVPLVLRVKNFWSMTPIVVNRPAGHSTQHDVEWRTR